jgi:hypothetical protein
MPTLVLGAKVRIQPAQTMAATSCAQSLLHSMPCSFSIFLRFVLLFFFASFHLRCAF